MKKSSNLIRTHFRVSETTSNLIRTHFRVSKTTSNLIRTHFREPETTSNLIRTHFREPETTSNLIRTHFRKPETTSNLIRTHFRPLEHLTNYFKHRIPTANIRKNRVRSTLRTRFLLFFSISTSLLAVSRCLVGEDGTDAVFARLTARPEYTGAEAVVPDCIFIVSFFRT